jgi:glycosyltransferase involved in cell wall biosynthesis
VPLRILMINYEYPPFGGGTGLACSQLLDELARFSDLEIDLVTSGPGGRVEVERPSPSIGIHRLPVRKRTDHFWRASELAEWTVRSLAYTRRLVATQRFDVCHCWSAWPAGPIGLALSKRLPYVVSLRGSDVPGYNERLRWLDPLVFRHVARRVWRDAAYVVAVSHSLRSLALETAPEARIDVIPNGVDTRLFRPGAGRTAVNLLFVGRLIERKGVDVLLRAFCDLAREHADVALTVAGDGPEKGRLQELCWQLGVAQRVTFLGHLDRTSLAERYRRASIFVLPALRDAMPNAALEAMASGLAVIATPGGAGDLIRDNGFVIAPRDPSSIRHAVGRYLADRQLLVAHQERSRALALRISWQAVAEYFNELYQALTGDCPERHIEALAARRHAVQSRRHAPPASVD